MNKKIIMVTAISVLMGAAFGYHGVLWYGDKVAQDKANEENAVKKGRVNAPLGTSASSNKSEKKGALHEILKERNYYRKRCALNTYYSSIKSEQREAEFQKIMALDEEQRGQVLEVFFYSWAKQEPRRALATGEQLTDPFHRRMVPYYVFRTWAEKNPEEAAAYFLESKDRLGEDGMFMIHTSNGVERGASCSIVKHLAKISPEKALEWIAHFENKKEQDTLKKNLIGLLARKDPLALLRDSSQLFPGEENKTFAAIAGQWVKQDPVAAQQWIETLPEEERKKSIESVVISLSSENPQESLALIKKNFDVKALASDCNFFLIPILCNVEYSEARQWMQSFPDSPEKCHIMVNYASLYFDRNYTEETEFIFTIPDKKMRNKAMIGTLNQWMLDDDVAAKKWIETAPLDKEDKALILKKRY